MKKWLLRSLYAAPVLLIGGLSWADYNATQGSGTTVFAFVCSVSKVCPASVLINSANTEIGTASNPIRVDPTGTTTQPVNVTNTNANGQATAANSSPVVLANNQTAADACMFQNKTNLPISQSGTASVQLIALSGATVIYVCSLSLIAAGATTVALTTGTGTACATGTAAVLGSATVANSLSLATNGGLTIGNGGGTVMKGAPSSELCMILGTNVVVAGNMTYVQQ